MSRKKTLEQVQGVLKKYAELQINLASESAQRDIANAIVNEIYAGKPGVVNLHEVVAISPYDLADDETPFGAPSSQKKIDNDL